MAAMTSGRLMAAGPPAGRNATLLLPTSARYIPFERADIEQSIPARFEQQVLRHADRIALRADAIALDYQALNTGANRIAHALLAIQTASGGVVALLTEPGANQIAAILGILKAGKIYVAMDPQYPGPRLASMLEDSMADVVITDAVNGRLASDLARGR